MLPCFVCGQHVESGWIKGFPTAPDSQKLALCQQHDSPDNRTLVERVWNWQMEQEISLLTRTEALRAGAVPRIITLQYSGGGSERIASVHFGLEDDKTLRITTPDGETRFYPLARIRNYSVTELGADDADTLLMGPPFTVLSPIDEHGPNAIIIDPHTSEAETDKNPFPSAQAEVRVKTVSEPTSKLKNTEIPDIKAKTAFDEATIKNFSNKMEHFQEHVQAIEDATSPKNEV